MTSALLRDADRYRRHQLVFEVGASALLAAATGRWDLVAVAGAIVLPGVRATWVRWLRCGPGLLPSGLAVLLAAPAGIGAVAVVWALCCAVGIGRRSRSLSGDRAPGPDRSP